MSTKKERQELTEMALKEWKVVVEILAERGEKWPETDTTSWGPGLTGAMQQVRVLVKACAVIGADDASDTKRLSDLYDQHQD